ncbi:MAG: tyrosine-protein phosphatase, partial [Rubrivivax sp.]
MSPTPSRVLPLQGATNFRDLGGYATRDGRRLRWRRVFRSDHLGGLTAADRETLAALGLA